MKHRGTVLWWKDSKGYGFISCPEINADVFVHHSGLHPSCNGMLRTGQEVELDVADGPRGRYAVNVFCALQEHKKEEQEQ